jgi:hypothetical protein
MKLVPLVRVAAEVEDDPAEGVAAAAMAVAEGGLEAVADAAEVGVAGTAIAGIAAEVAIAAGNCTASL